MNRRLRAVTIGAITAASTIVVGAIGAEVALAHHNTVTGVSSCESDGTYTIAWTIVNSESAANKSERVTRVTPLTGTFSPALPIWDSSQPNNGILIAPSGSAVVNQTGIPGTTSGSVTLKVHGRWATGENYENTSAPVSLSGKCVAPVAPAVTQTPVCGEYDTWATVATTGIQYSKNGPNGSYASSQNGQFSAGNLSQDVWAKPTSGYSMANPNPRKFTITNGTVEQCGTPVMPVVTPTQVCGAYDTYKAGATTGVVYSNDNGATWQAVINGTLPNPANTITIKAKAADGYVLSPGATTSFVLNGSAIEQCVAPVTPVITVKTECGVADTFTAGPTLHVVYTPTSGTLAAGDNVDVVVATPEAGYVFVGPQTVKYTLTGSIIETCSTPVAPVVTVKTECGVLDTFTAGPTSGVLYSTDGVNYVAAVNGSLNAGNNAGVVKAKADAGYALTVGSPTSFDLIGSAIEKCGDADPPTIVTTSDCGILDTFSAGPTTGVLYSTDGVTFTPTVSGNLPTGQSVTVTAGPDTANGYNFPTETFPLTGGIVEVCPTTVTPVPPAVVTPPCGEPSTFTTTPVTGIVYSQTSGTLTPGVDTVITVTAADGYVLAPGSPTSYTLTGPAIIACEEPTTTTAQVSVEPPPPIVAPPAPEAPPMGLPETGSSNTIQLLLGGFLLIAGTALLGFVRRRTVKIKS